MLSSLVVLPGETMQLFPHNRMAVMVSELHSGLCVYERAGNALVHKGNPCPWHRPSNPASKAYMLSLYFPKVRKPETGFKSKPSWRVGHIQQDASQSRFTNLLVRTYSLCQGITSNSASPWLLIVLSEYFFHDVVNMIFDSVDHKVPSPGFPSEIPPSHE